MTTEQVSKASRVMGELFNHRARSPEHHHLVGGFLDFGAAWGFRCEDCGREWALSRLDILSEPLLAQLVNDGVGPQRVLEALANIPGASYTPNAWERIREGILDD